MATSCAERPSTSGDVVTEPDVDSTDDNENSGSPQNGSDGKGGLSGNAGTGTVIPSSSEGDDEG